MRSLLRAFAGGAGLLFVVAGCQPINGNSLLTDQKDDPSKYTLSKEPKSEELYLKAYTPTFQATDQSKIDVAGECYVSTYPSHSIVALLGSVQLAIIDLNPSTASGTNIATCKNGKFNIVIDTGFSLPNGVNSVRLILRARDANNQVVVNEAQGASTITVTK